MHNSCQTGKQQSRRKKKLATWYRCLRKTTNGTSGRKSFQRNVLRVQGDQLAEQQEFHCGLGMRVFSHLYKKIHRLVAARERFECGCVKKSTERSPQRGQGGIDIVKRTEASSSSCRCSSWRLAVREAGARSCRTDWRSCLWESSQRRSGLSLSLMYLPGFL